MKKIDIDKLAEQINNSTDFTMVEIEKQSVKLPLYLTMGSLIEYENLININKDYRKAFCRLLSELADYFEKHEKQINFEQLPDKQLLDIMKEILTRDDYLGDYFNTNQCEYSFENFYNAYEEKSKETAAQMKKIFQPYSSSLTDFAMRTQEITKNLMKPYENINKSMFIYNNIANVYKHMPTINTLLATNQIVTPQIENQAKLRDFSIDLVNLKSPATITNELLEKNNEIAENHLLQNEKLLKKIDEETVNREKSDRKLERKQNMQFIINLIISLVGILIAILSLIGFDKVKSFF